MKSPVDPNIFRALPRWQRALKWRLPLECGQLISKVTYKEIARCIDIQSLQYIQADRGPERDGTAVTHGQRDLLLAALDATSEQADPIAEIGSWTGISTVDLAGATRRTVFAIDPHLVDDFPGINDAFAEFRARIATHSSIIHLRRTSGDACEYLQRQNQSLSFVFIDAIHDYINAWFDFQAWERLVVPGGMIVFHDVDDHVGTNRACRKVLADKRFEIWGYAPNIVAFRKKSL